MRNHQHKHKHKHKRKREPESDELSFDKRMKSKVPVSPRPSAIVGNALQQFSIVAQADIGPYKNVFKTTFIIFKKYPNLFLDTLEAEYQKAISSFVSEIIQWLSQALCSDVKLFTTELQSIYEVYKKFPDLFLKELVCQNPNIIVLYLRLFDDASVRSLVLDLVSHLKGER